MLRLSFRTRIAALCGIALSTASILPAFAFDNLCVGHRAGETGYILRQELVGLYRQSVSPSNEVSKQKCTSDKLVLSRRALSVARQLVEFNAKTIGSSQCVWNARNKRVSEANIRAAEEWRKIVSECESVIGIQSSSNTSANNTGASTPYPFDCKKRPIDANVAWYYSCNPVTESAGLKKAAYRHPITPQALYGKAWAVCNSKPVEQQRSCISDAKLKVLLTEDSSIRAKCGGLSGDQQIICVDRYYLYGPNADARKNIRAHIKEILDHQNRVEAALRRLYIQTVTERDKLDRSDPRWGELDELAFDYNYALSGKDDEVPPKADSLSKSINPEPLTTAQQRFDDVVRASVDVAIEANKARLNEKDQKECAAAAYKTVWGVMSGYSDIEAPEKCSGVVSDAVAQLAYQAAARVGPPPPPEEDLLRHYLALRSPNTGGKNDGTLDAPFEAKGLTPETDVKNEGEQLLRERQ